MICQEIVDVYERMPWFDKPKTMDEVIRKERVCYQKNKQKGEGGKKWNEKRGGKFSSNNNKVNKFMINKPPRGQINRSMNRNQNRFKFSNETKTNE